MGITVKEFDEKRALADRTADDLSQGVQALDQVFHTLKDVLKLSEKDMEKVRPDLNQAIMAANAAVRQLRNYSALLDDIAKKTELDWAPSCRKMGDS